MHKILFAKSPDSAHPFIRRMLAELHEHHVDVRVTPYRQVHNSKGDQGCAGYFGNDPLRFAVALGKPFEDWFLVLIHEFSHFKQWQDDPKAFQRSANAIDKFFTWMDGGHLPPQRLQRYAEMARDLEYDCERRVLASLKAFGIEHLVDAKEYAQKANSYFNFYNYIAKHRVWYVGGREPYTLPEVWTSFPKRLVVETGMTPKREAMFALCV